MRLADRPRRWWAIGLGGLLLLTVQHNAVHLDSTRDTAEFVGRLTGLIIGTLGGLWLIFWGKGQRLRVK